MTNNRKEDPITPRASEQPQFGAHADWHAAFLQNTTQKRVQELEALRILQREFPRMRERMRNPYYKLEFLFAGGGTGLAETALVLNIANNTPRYDSLIEGEKYSFDELAVYYNDPSSQMQERFKATLNKFGLGETLKASSAQKFEDPAYKPPDVDLTLAFQMWYYVNGWQGVPFENNSLVKLAKTVQKKKGVAVVSVQSENGDLFKVRGKQLPKIHGYNDLTSERVTEELNRLGISFKSSTARSVTDVTWCFHGQEFDPTDEGKNILSFMLRTPWDTMSKPLQQEVAEDIKRLVEANRNDPMIASYQNVKVLFFADTYIFIPGNQARLSEV